MADYTSALHHHVKPGLYGNLQNGKASLSVQEMTGIVITQLAAFPAQKTAFHKFLFDRFQFGLPQPGKVETGMSTKGTRCFSARLDPAKIILMTDSTPDNIPAEFYPLDLSDARTVLKIEGANAEALLARLCAVDLSDKAFPDGSFAMTGMHHVSVSIWRYQTAYMLFMPRSFAASLYHLIMQIAEQFGCEVLDTENWSTK